MRFYVGAFLSLLLTVPVGAQAQGPLIKIHQALVGFPSYVPEEGPGRFKVGLWSPIAVDLEAGPRGLDRAELLTETADSDNVATVYKVPIAALAKNERRTVLAYIKPGNSEGRFTIKVHGKDHELINPVSSSQQPLDLRGRLYLTVGARLPALQDALIALRQQRPEFGGDQDKRDSFPRYAAYATDPDLLPTLALGYDGVDLMILTTANNNRLGKLLRDPTRMKAIAQWTAQGGRLVISVSWRNQVEVAKLLGMPAWQPPVPVVLPAAQLRVQENAVPRLISIENWAQMTAVRPFPALGEKPVPVALLQSGQSPQWQWEVQADTKDGRPLIATMPYGRGNITLLAFDLDEGPFTVWNGRAQFLKALITKLEPRIPQGQAVNQHQGFVPGIGQGQDLTTELQMILDQFDVPIIPFGWVALFIVVYILIVGPLDYFLLKNVFKRLEWTWITFPTVVLIVSVAAYFTAYAVKGQDLKINKIDVVDFDLRTDLDENLRTRRVYAYGQTWFTIMSPRIQSYTIGIEPRVPAWWPGPKETASAEVVSWLGRPEIDGPGAMGRSRSQGWSHRSYAYETDAAGLIGVPIPVWTTKAFTASWSALLPRRPVEANLVYHQNQNKDLKISGTIKSFLPADLEDVWIFYRNRCYPLDKGLPRSKAGDQGQSIDLGTRGADIPGWPNRTAGLEPRLRMSYNPDGVVKNFLFHEKVDSGSNRRNFAQHRLDLSWRLQDEPKAGQENLREVILYGRMAAAAGPAEDLFRDQPQPTLVWLGDLPAAGKKRPELIGTLAQDTYIRLILPVKAAE